MTLERKKQMMRTNILPQGATSSPAQARIAAHRRAEEEARRIFLANPELTWAEIGARAGCSRRRASLACAGMLGADRRGRQPDTARRQKARDLYAELRDWRAVGRAMGISGQAAHYLAHVGQEKKNGQP